MQEVRSSCADEVAAYARIALQAAAYYFVLQRLWQRHPVYYRSFGSFLQTFKSCIGSEKAKPAEEDGDRAQAVDNSSGRFMGSLYSALTQHLMASHKQVFGLLALVQVRASPFAVLKTSSRLKRAEPRPLPLCRCPHPPDMTSPAWCCCSACTATAALHPQSGAPSPRRSKARRGNALHPTRAV